jgi:hypothetical protein
MVEPPRARIEEIVAVGRGDPARNRLRFGDGQDAARA